MVADLIPSLRAASGKLAREWGFLRPPLAGTALSHAAVHCLIEISDHSPRSFSDLAPELRVSPSDLRPVVAELLASSNITLTPPSTNLPIEDHYSLTPAGLEVLGEVAHPTFGTDITTALGLYTAAIETARLNDANPTPEHTPIASLIRAPTPGPPQPTIRIVTGYIPGILGRTLEMHATYYSALLGWGQEFEADLGTGISDLVRRLANPVNQAWSVVRTIPGTQEHIEGVIFVDGEKQGEEGVARIRAFILDDSVRGLGLGKRLVEEAMQFVRDTGFRECRLQTMRILVPAIKLYEREGFVEVGEEWETHWGRGHMALHFTWRRDRDLKVGSVSVDR